MYKKLYENPSMVVNLSVIDDVIMTSGFDGFNSDDKDNWTDRGVDIL